MYSDNGLYKLVASRRAISEEYHGVKRYYGSKWFIETFSRSVNVFVPMKFAGISYIVRSKKDIVGMLSKSVQFTQAYAEMKTM